MRSLRIGYVGLFRERFGGMVWHARLSLEWACNETFVQQQPVALLLEEIETAYSSLCGEEKGWNSC